MTTFSKLKINEAKALGQIISEEKVKYKAYLSELRDHNLKFQSQLIRSEDEKDQKVLTSPTRHF